MYPFSFKSADILEKDINLKVFKVGSGELTNTFTTLYCEKTTSNDSFNGYVKFT